MYDPWIGRFLQEDTVTGDKNDPLSLNLYTYVKNNPIIYNDPTGHTWQMIVGGAVLGVAGQYIGDVIDNFKEGKSGIDVLAPKSSPERYAGTALGGAAAGAVFGTTNNPILAGAAYGGTSTLVSEGLEALTGREERSIEEITADTLGNTVGGAIGGLGFKGTGCPGIGGAFGGFFSTSISELLKNAFGVSNRTQDQIIRDATVNAIDSFIVTGLTGMLTSPAGNNKNQNTPKENNGLQPAMADGPDIISDRITKGNDTVKIGEQTPVQENANKITNSAGGKEGTSKAEINLSRNVTKASELDPGMLGKLKNEGTVSSGGRSGGNRPLEGTPNSYVKTDAGHTLVYDGGGRLIYDITPSRVKMTVWDEAPNGNLYNRDIKLEGQVPSELLK